MKSICLCFEGSRHNRMKEVFEDLVMRRFARRDQDWPAREATMSRDGMNRMRLSYKPQDQ